MKITLLSICCLVTLQAAGQGKFAGSYASLIGKKYTDEKQLTLLNGFTYRGGTMLSDVNDPDGFSGGWYVKGNLIVALFEQKIGDKGRAILDVLEIKNVQKDQELSIGVCQDGESVNEGIVALVQVSKDERFKAVKAWYFNRDKIRIDIFASDKVTCLGMVGDD